MWAVLTPYCSDKMTGTCYEQSVGVSLKEYEWDGLASGMVLPSWDGPEGGEGQQYGGIRHYSVYQL